MQDLGGKRHISKVKESLSELMTDVQKYRINEGLMINAIFDFKKNEKGQNHIFDDLECADKDFTEEDLKDNITPLKQPTYFDTNLSETMGKLSKSIGAHKSIIMHNKSSSAETTQTSREKSERGKL